MANLIWTGILYFSTLSIVFITYRTFVNDRKADNENRSRDIVVRAQSKMRESAAGPKEAPTAAKRPAPLVQQARAPIGR